MGNGKVYMKGRGGLIYWGKQSIYLRGGEGVR